MKITPPTKIYIDKSPIHGIGVFAKEIIYEGEVIEETPLLDLHIKPGSASPVLLDYRFNWPQGSGGEWTKQVLPYGYGAIYNHSDNSNATWRSNLENETFEFVTNRDIEIDEEIFTYYGGIEYWEDGRIKTNVV